MSKRDFPRYVRIDRSKQDTIQKLINSPLSPFNKLKQRDVFMYAAAVGAHFGSRTPLKEKMDLNLWSDLPERYQILADVIALTAFKYDIDKILDGREVATALEEFANGGVSRLYDMIMGGITRNKLEEIIFEMGEGSK